MMRALWYWPLILILSVALTGCPDPDGPPPPQPGNETDDLHDDDLAVCLRGEPFVGEGSIPVDDLEPADAHEIATARWEAHDGCERIVIDLVDEEGNPATRPGAVTAEVIREKGIVRIDLRDVRWVDPDATDYTFDGDLAAAAFAVWSPDGEWSFVDVHLAGAAEAHVNTLQEPARVVIDLRPGGAPVPDPAPHENQVVVLQPRPGEAAYPLEVVGYARTFEANVVVRLAQDGEDVYDDFTTATAWADAWGYYTFTIEDGPSGPVTLHVGEHSARDGTWQGVAIDLQMNE